MESNTMKTIKKIPLENFISILVELYDKGVNFIDISGASKNNQDMIKINVLEEYMEENFSTPFSEEDFNNLII